MENRPPEPVEEDPTQLFIKGLSEKDKKSYDIAKKLLGNSFTLKKSIAYLEWLKKKS